MRHITFGIELNMPLAGPDIDIAFHEARLTLRDGTPVLIRRLVVEDAALYPDFLSNDGLVNWLEICPVFGP